MKKSLKVPIISNDGEVLYYGKVVDDLSSCELYQQLLTEIDWQRDEVMMFGKRILTKRKVAWYALSPMTYTYSNVTKTSQPFNDVLFRLLHLTEELTAESYNSCLLNLYHNGDEGMAYHSDAEPDLKPNGSIASWSFGAKRKFSFKHKQTKERVDVWLENGSLLEMKGATQKHWLHRLPPTKKVSDIRINLTFRSII